MATTAASIGTPQPRKRNQANLTAMKDIAGARRRGTTARKGAYQPGGRTTPLGARAAGRRGGQQPGGRRGGPQAYAGPMARGWGAPGQFSGPPMRGPGPPGQFGGSPLAGGGGGGGGFGGYPGSTNWWSQRPQMPGAQQWGSPQFNYQSSYAPSAQPGMSPPWGGGYGGGQQPMPGQYQTGGRPQVGMGQLGTQASWGNQMGGYGGGGYGQQQYGGGMPYGGMPSYQMPGMQNTALGPLQNRIWQERMQTEMPSRVRKMTRFQGAAGNLGFDPYSLPGYGSQWGYSPAGWYGGGENQTQGGPWTSSWGGQMPGQLSANVPRRRSLITGIRGR